MFKQCEAVCNSMNSEDSMKQCKQCIACSASSISDGIFLYHRYHFYRYQTIWRSRKLLGQHHPHTLLRLVDGTVGLTTASDNSTLLANISWFIKCFIALRKVRACGDGYKGKLGLGDQESRHQPTEVGDYKSQDGYHDHQRSSGGKYLQIQIQRQ